MPLNCGARGLFLVLLGAMACRGGGSATPAGLAGLRDTAPALVIQEAAVVAFWLPASDTLAPGEGADLLDDFRAYAHLAGPSLDERGIPLLGTNAESLLVDLSGGPRRVIMLSGLDYPFGYVLVEPGYAESILTGVYTEEELLAEVDWYFGLGEDGERRERRGQVVVRGP
jgi:hypothetical protein